MKIKNLKSSEISYKALIKLDSPEEKQHWIKWIKGSIYRRENKPKPAFRHINWLERIQSCWLKQQSEEQVKRA